MFKGPVIELHCISFLRNNDVSVCIIKFFPKYIILAVLPELYYSKIISTKKLPPTEIEPATLGLWCLLFVFALFPS